MGDQDTETTRAEVRAASGEAPAGRDWTALVRRVWPYVAMVLAVVLWWPTGFGGYSPVLHLPLTATTDAGLVSQGSIVLLGCLVAAAVVSALVSAPWPRFGIAFGLTVVAWVLADGSTDLPAGERPVLAGLAGLGMLLGLWVGARARGGVIAAATFLALVAGLSPGTWGRGPVLAVAVALPFWVATRDRVAPTILAVVRVVLTWLVTVLVSVGLHHGWAQLPPGLAGSDPVEAATVVGREFVDFLRERWAEVVEAAARSYTGWIWLAVVLAIAFVLAAAALKRRRTKAS